VVYYTQPVLAPEASMPDSLPEAERFFYKAIDMINLMKLADSHGLALEIRERCVGFGFSVLYHATDFRAALVEGVQYSTALAYASSGVLSDACSITLFQGLIHRAEETRFLTA
jgi:hypothetical protein